MASWLALSPVAAFLLWCALGLWVLVRGIRQLRRAAREPAAAPAVPWGIALLRSPWTGAFWLVVGLVGLVVWRPAIGWQTEDGAYWTDDGAPAVADAVRASILDWAREERPVGVAVGVITPDGAAQATLGRARLRPGGPPLRETALEIGSLTKTFTAVLLAAHVERGVVRLDDTLPDLLPAEVDLPPPLRAITLAQLATHSAGLPRVPPGMVDLRRLLRVLAGLNPYAGYTTDDLLHALERTELESEPGETFEYSNLGYGLLGWMLAREAGLQYADAIRTFVQEPLGLPAGAIEPAARSAAPTAAGYRVRQGVGPLRIGLRADPWDLPEPLQGAGDLRSTLPGMLAWLSANMRAAGAKSDKPSPALAALRLTQQAHFRVTPQRTIGLAWVRDERPDIGGQTVIWHNGGTGGFRSFLGFTADGRFGVVVLANATASVDPLGGRILRAIARPYVAQESD